MTTQFSISDRCAMIVGDNGGGVSLAAMIPLMAHDGPIFDHDGNQIGTLKLVMRTPSLPPQKIEAGYDPAILKRPGCCDPPTA